MADTITFNKCLECKKINKVSCCEGWLKFPLMIEDINTITSLGYQIQDFVIAGEYKLESMHDDEAWWKNSLIKIGKNFFKTNIKKNKNGDCIFLSDGHGCTLRDNRPLVCKIYPFWVDEKGEVVYEPGEEADCLMGQSGISVWEALKLVEEDNKTIQNYFSKIKKDCIENKDKHKKIILDILKLN
ncbi:MAG: YkgJ family cysteine cluster protein [Candidatus Magasanikbacteria bacterium]